MQDKSENEIPLLTESEFNKDIENIAKNSLIENLQFTIKEFSSQFVKILLTPFLTINRKLRNFSISRAVRFNLITD